MPTLLARIAFALHVVAMFGALPVIAAVIGADVVLRYGFNAPLLWSFEANGAFLLIAVFGTLPYVTQRDRHIRMEILYRKFGPRARAAADVAAAVTGAMFSGLLCYQMAHDIPTMIRDNESGEFFAVQYWPFAAFLSVVGAIMTLQLLMNVPRALGLIGAPANGSDA